MKSHNALRLFEWFEHQNDKTCMPHEAYVVEAKNWQIQNNLNLEPKGLEVISDVKVNDKELVSDQIDISGLPMRGKVQDE